MVDEILTAVGIPYKETAFAKPPTGTYAVWLDQIDFRGGDDSISIEEHAVSIELYSPKPDPVNENKIIDELIRKNLEFAKSPRYKLESEQLYQVIFTFDYIEKRS